MVDLGTSAVLERDTQLASLVEYAGEAARGAGRLVLVAGEAGVGKSTLVDRLHASRPDARWLAGACDGLFTPRPLAPLLDVAEHLDGGLADLVVADVPTSELFAAVLRALDEPGVLTVLVVEDLHFADEATLDLVRFLGRRVASTHVLVVVTYRDEGLAGDAALSVTVGHLATQRSTRRIDVPTLTPEAVAELARGSGLDPSEVYRLTGGNSFFVTELLHAGGAPLPTSARDAVLASVARLSAAARSTVEAAALTGPRVQPELLGPDADLSALDELVSVGLLVDGGAHLRFRHELAQLAVEQSVPAHRRAAIHRDVLERLESTGCDDDARLAYHAEGAGDAAAVLRHAPLAARQASAAAAHREALAQLQRALRFADAADPRTRAELSDALAAEASLVDRWQLALDARTDALAYWHEAGDRVREGRSLRGLSHALWRMARGQQSQEAAEQALALLEPLGPSEELAWSYASLAGTAADQARGADALELVARARAVAEPLGLTEVLVDVQDTAGCALADAGRAWEHELVGALRTSLDAGLHEQAGRAYLNLAFLHDRRLSFTEAGGFAAAGITYCDDYDITTYGRCLRGELAWQRSQQGGWAEAIAICRELLAEPGVSSVNRMVPLTTLGALLARTGADGVWEHLDEAAFASDGLGEPQWIVPVHLARAEAHWIAGEHAAAVADAACAVDAARRYDQRSRGESAVWWARLTGAPPDDLDVDVDEPYASQLRGEHVRAAELWDAIGGRYEATLALADCTDEPVLREALVRLDTFGATAVARVVRQRMRDLGVRSVPTGARAATREHPAGLTRREREVLEQLVDGASNEQIAERLVISVKTVDHHVSAVLGKLGVPSRKVAATEAVRLGLVPDAGPAR